MKLSDKELQIDQLKLQLSNTDKNKYSQLKDLETTLARVEVELAQRKRAQLDTELKLQKAKLDSDKLKKSSSTEIYSLKEELLRSRMKSWLRILKL